MSKFIAIALVVALATPAMAISSSAYYLGLDTARYRCSVSAEPLKPGMRLLGIYKSQAEAEKAMREMRQCKA